VEPRAPRQPLFGAHSSPVSDLAFCPVAAPSPDSPTPNTYLLPAACQIGPHPAPGIISARDCRRHGHPQARTWLVPVSYVSRTCLVRGGSPLRRKMASFGRIQPPALLWSFGLVILAGSGCAILARLPERWTWMPQLNSEDAKTQRLKQGTACLFTSTSRRHLAGESKPPLGLLVPRPVLRVFAPSLFTSNCGF
jgi:hypothetical protein